MCARLSAGVGRHRRRHSHRRTREHWRFHMVFRSKRVGVCCCTPYDDENSHFPNGMGLQHRRDYLRGHNTLKPTPTQTITTYLYSAQYRKLTDKHARTLHNTAKANTDMLYPVERRNCVCRPRRWNGDSGYCLFVPLTQHTQRTNRMFMS